MVTGGNFSATGGRVAQLLAIINAAAALANKAE
jgi:hypothetical protein